MTVLHRASWTPNPGEKNEKEGWVVGFIHRPVIGPPGFEFIPPCDTYAVVILPDDTYEEVPIGKLKFKRWDES